MARGSKKKKRTPKQRRRHTPLAGLKRKLAHGPLHGSTLLMAPAGQEKMSEVLAAFIEPYAHVADSEAAYRKLLRLAIVAWNATLLPEPEQHTLVDQVLAPGLPQVPTELKTELRDFIQTLMARKQAYFAQHQRMILEFELQDTGTGYQLFVASSLEETPRG